MSLRRVSLSQESLTPVEIAEHRAILQAALRQLYQHPPPWLYERFVDEPRSVMLEHLQERLSETDRETSLTLLASIEAAFRVDFLDRVYQRKKDPLSRAYRRLYQDKGTRVSLVDDILPLWRDLTLSSPKLVGELRGAFNYRHWLAHGRYWVARLGRRYDFDSVYILAEAVIEAMQTAAPQATS